MSDGWVWVYDAGGGAGCDGLQFEALREAQVKMYARSISGLAPIQCADRDQEQRQLLVKQQLVRITVKVSREDFPNVSALIKVTYIQDSPQGAWGKFLSDVSKKLKVEFVHSLVERGDRAPIDCIIRLKDGGDYLVRQRESSSVLEVLLTNVPPIEYSWEITKDVIAAKTNLEFADRNFANTQGRIDTLIRRPATALQEKFLCEYILAAKKPEDIVYAIVALYKNDSQSTSAKKLEMGDFRTATAFLNFANVSQFKNQVDVFNVIRLSLESLHRLAVRGKLKEVVKEGFDFLIKVLEELVHEVDVVVMGLGLLREMMTKLVPQKNVVFNCVLDTLQHHSPDAPGHRPRRPKRLEKASWDVGIMQRQGKKGKESLPQAMLAPQKEERRRLTEGYRIGEEMTMTQQRYGEFYTSSRDLDSYQQFAQRLADYPRIMTLDEQLRPVVVRRHHRQSEGHDDVGCATVVGATSATSPRVAIDEEKESIGLLQTKGRYNPTAARQAIQLAQRGSQAYAAERPERKLLSVVADADGEEDDGAEKAVVVAAAPQRSTVKQKTQYRIIYRPSTLRPGDAEQEPVWSGTQGQIGRPAKAKRGISPVDFRVSKTAEDAEGVPPRRTIHPGASPVASDNSKPTPGQGDLSKAALADKQLSAETPALAKQEQKEKVIKVEESALPAVMEPKENEVEEEEGSEANSEERPSSMPWILRFQAKKRKSKVPVVLQPLPDVPCVKFRGYADRTKANAVLTQGFSCLLYFLVLNFGNRDWAFKFGVVEEVADLVLVSHAVPKLQEYFVMIIETMYREGFGDHRYPIDEKLFDPDDPSMNVSNSQGRQGTDADNGALGLVFDAVSEVTIPTIDTDADFNSLSDASDPSESFNKLHSRTARKVAAAAIAVGEGNDLKTAAAYSPPTHTRRANTIQAAPTSAATYANRGKSQAFKMLYSQNVNGEILDALGGGLAEYEERYVKTPEESVILALAMCSANVEIGLEERNRATFWLELWDDGSRDYKLLVMKGKNICGL